MSFLAIEWNPSIGIDLGFFVIRWYSLMFVTAFLLGLRIMKKIYVTDNIPLEKVYGRGAFEPQLKDHNRLH